MSRIPKGDVLGLWLSNFCILVIVHYDMAIFPSRVIFIANENKYGKHNMSAFLNISKMKRTYFEILKCNEFNLLLAGFVQTGVLFVFPYLTFSPLRSLISIK